MANIGVSTLGIQLSILSTQRFLAVHNPFYAHTHVTKEWTEKIVIIHWILTAIVYVPLTTVLCVNMKPKYLLAMNYFLTTISGITFVVNIVLHAIIFYIILKRNSPGEVTMASQDGAGSQDRQAIVYTATLAGGHIVSFVITVYVVFWATTHFAIYFLPASVGIINGACFIWKEIISCK